MKDIKKQDLKDTDRFNKFGDSFEKIYADDDNHTYIFKRTSDYGKVSYELVKGKKFKQPDGKEVYVYPSSEQFGVNAWYILNNAKTRERIEYYLSTRFPKEAYAKFIYSKVVLS